MAVKTSRTPAGNKLGWEPDADPDIARGLVEAWAAAYLDLNSDANVLAEGKYLRASDAGACARALGYRIRRRIKADELAEHRITDQCDGSIDGAVDCPICTEILEHTVPLSDPPTIADRYRMNTGTLVHDELAKHLEAAFGEGAKAEVITVREDEPGISMHVDAVIRMADDSVTVVEIKTINGFGFKDTIGIAKQGKPARGPRHNAVVQGALAAFEHEADRLVILVFTLELVGKQYAERNHLDELGTMVAQFSLTPEQFLPIAEAEHRRMKAALTLVEQGTLPPRSIPDPELPHGNRIVNPATGEWVLEDKAGNVINLGNTWHCDYCWDRGNCLQDGPT